MAAPSSLSAAPSSSASLNGLPKATLTGYVGFDSITDQIQKKLVKRGFAFNLMVVGRSGLGKSTLVNTLFASHLVESKGLAPPAKQPKSTLCSISLRKRAFDLLSLSPTLPDMATKSTMKTVGILSSSTSRTSMPSISAVNSTHSENAES
ncbi:hypothetical protein BASA81_012227 [Batrachochytrium salamandrivorans]|nr:hypothetical protein BASA62_007810 [Batrachochytrium salamandrivorans]KAH9249980.1 hypothetical protein BASA81_012227 [Batrachochytrium salamandrivorans]